MRSYFFILATFFSLLAEAQLQGEWNGYGRWTFKGEGEGVHCSRMQMYWSETSDIVSIEKGYFDCEYVAMHLEKTSWKIQDGKLLDADQNVVGLYDKKKFEVRMKNPDDSTSIHIQLDRNDGHYDYQETWSNEYEKIYVISGRFFLKGY